MNEPKVTHGRCTHGTMVGRYCHECTEPTQQVEPNNAEIRKWLETHDCTFGTRKEIVLLVLDRLKAAEVKRDTSELHRAIKNLRASNKELVKSDKYREKIWKDRVSALQDIINKAKVDPNTDQSVERAVDNSYTGQIAQWRKRAEKAEETIRKVRSEFRHYHREHHAPEVLGAIKAIIEEYNNDS